MGSTGNRARRGAPFFQSGKRRSGRGANVLQTTENGSVAWVDRCARRAHGLCRRPSGCAQPPGRGEPKGPPRELGAALISQTRKACKKQTKKGLAFAGLGDACRSCPDGMFGRSPLESAPAHNRFPFIPEGKGLLKRRRNIHQENRAHHARASLPQAAQASPWWAWWASPRRLYPFAQARLLGTPSGRLLRAIVLARSPVAGWKPIQE